MCKGIIRIETVAAVTMAINGVVSTWGMPALNIEVANYTAAAFIIAPMIIETVLYDAGIAAEDIPGLIAAQGL